ncbi:MAG: hypothetical protein HQL90_15485 [Magnetococcales bacterium]|nr:hypothetical protein [Magnetococcales bacterium]
MRVIVDSILLSRPTEDEILQINRLLSFGHERHTLVFDPPEALENYLQATFSQKVADIYRRCIANATRTATRLPANCATVRVTAITTPVWQDPIAVLPLGEALQLLEEPLGIFLENNQNDWHFLLGIMRPSERERLQDAAKRGWATPLHGGGSTLKQQLTNRLSATHKALRTFALFDSDRRHPDELKPDWDPSGKESCEGREIERVAQNMMAGRYWMLKRRFIESYMPREYISRMTNNVPPGAVEAFFRLSQAGRWYFNMKKGFNGDAPGENGHRCRDLYDAVEPADRAALSKGFSNSLANHYQSTAQNEFDWDSEARQEAEQNLPQLMRLL